MNKMEILEILIVASDKMHGIRTKKSVKLSATIYRLRENMKIEDRHKEIILEFTGEDYIRPLEERKILSRLALIKLIQIAYEDNVKYYSPNQKEIGSFLLAASHKWSTGQFQKKWIKENASKEVGEWYTNHNYKKEEHIMYYTEAGYIKTWQIAYMEDNFNKNMFNTILKSL